jgi:two-component system, chemotaxis family, chemotaxis protein CheY
MQQLNVLVVDDSILATEVLKGALQELGHKVVNTAKSGAEALATYRTTNPDVVTMDVTMPGIDGIAAARNIIKEFPDARVIMVTSHAQKGMVMQALDAGAKGYILKPIKKDKLREILAQVAKASSVELFT